MNFESWLQEELDKRGWKQANLVKVGVDSAYLSRVLNGLQRPGPSFCHKVARALNLPDVEVFERAGLLDGLPKGDAAIEEYIRLRLPLISGERRSALLSFLDHLVERERVEQAITADLEALDPDNGE